jgi:predicted AlkP superfamily phosphohydrolase/phosphomutase
MKAETATTSPAPLRKGANEKKKVIIIGLDGGTWNIIHPLIKEGKLKHFKKLVKEGVHGVLKSTIPPVTGPAWTSFSTGRNPGKHGIYDFIKIENNDIKLFSSKDVCETFYDVLSRNGYTNVIIGLPLSYPPHVNFKGIMISDFLYPYKKIYPEKKSDYLNNYDLFAPPGESQDDYLNELLKTASNRIKTLVFT